MSKSSLTRLAETRGAWEQGGEVVVNPSATCGSCSADSCNTADQLLLDKIQEAHGTSRRIETAHGPYIAIGGPAADKIKRETTLGGRW